MLKTFPICRWSGQLGPKRREGDRQAPEGFYTITPGQMNPNSAYYLSFDTGYPNAYDRAHNGTGSALMVHGTCSSRGCYAMTDEGIGEIYALAREAFASGQKGFQFQSYPFRMTAENLAKFRHDPNMPFWKNLKEGSDAFDITRRETKVAVCNGRYAFDTVGSTCAPDPTLAAAVAEKDQHDREQVAELIAKGTPAVRLVYADGGQHESFRQTAFSAFGDAGRGFTTLAEGSRRNLGEVSRPEALAEGPREIPLDGPATRPAARGIAVASLDVSKKIRPAEPTLGEKAAPTSIAGAEPREASPAAASESRSFYDRLVGGVFGSREPEPEPAGEGAASEAPLSAPLPPPRGTTSLASSASRPSQAGGTVKPQAARQALQRHVDASDVLPGSHGIGPAAGGFSRN